MMGCKNFPNFREEFRLRNFAFWHWSRSHFVASPWLTLPVFTTYRLVFAIYFLAIWIWDVSKTDEYPDGKFFIYYTNLTYTFGVVYFIYGSILCIIELAKQRKHRTTMVEMKSTTCAVDAGDDEEAQQEDATHLWIKREDDLLAHHKIFWFVYTIAANDGLMLSIGYWLVIYDGSAIDISNVTKHGLNAFMMLIETVISSVPVRLYHTTYAVIFSILYIVFTVLYWVGGGTDTRGRPYIYKALDWGNVNTTITITLPFFLIIVTPLLQLLFYGLYKIRFWLETKYNPEPIGCRINGN